jgi:hypothetical protein
MPLVRRSVSSFSTIRAGCKRLQKLKVVTLLPLPNFCEPQPICGVLGSNRIPLIPTESTTQAILPLSNTIFEAVQPSFTLVQCHTRGNTMTNLAGVVQQLRQERDRAAKEVERLDTALAALNGAGNSKRTGGRNLSVAARARIAAAQRARWARVKASKNQSRNGSAAPKRAISAAARKRMAVAQRARWAKVRARKKAA